MSDFFDVSFLTLVYGLVTYVSFLVAFVVDMLVLFFVLYGLNNWKPHDSPVYEYVIRPALEVAAIPFVIADVVLNYCLVFVMADPPASWGETVSQRLGRYLWDESPFSFRGRFAAFFCSILSKADPNHCRKNGPRR